MIVWEILKKSFLQNTIIVKMVLSLGHQKVLKLVTIIFNNKNLSIHIIFRFFVKYIL